MSGTEALKGDRWLLNRMTPHLCSLEVCNKKKKEKRKREKLMMLNKPNGQPRRNQRRQLEAHSAFFCQFPSPNGETICSYWKTVEPCCFRYGFDDVLLGSYLTFLGEILGNCFFSVIYISSIFGHQICSG